MGGPGRAEGGLAKSILQSHCAAPLQRYQREVCGGQGSHGELAGGRHGLAGRSDHWRDSDRGSPAKEIPVANLHKLAGCQWPGSG